MYGHKIIEGLETEINFFKNRENGGAVSYWKKTITELKNAVHFYFDAPVENAVDMNNEKRLELYNEGIRILTENLPHKAMCIQFKVIAQEILPDSQGNIGERHGAPMAAMIDQSTFATTLKVFMFSKELKQWIPSGLNAVISNDDAAFKWAWDVNATRDTPLSSFEREASEVAVLEAFFRAVKMIQLLNCKNITSTDTPPPDKLQKKRIKRGKVPMFTYKTLKILVPGKKQNHLKNGKGQKDDIYYNRIHLCRGHFKTYTKEKPLFGRMTGTYWWQPSVRGNKKNGVIHKDYAVSVA